MTPRVDQPIKIESVTDSQPAAEVSKLGTNLEVENAVALIRSHLSSVDEYVNQFEYNKTDDQFYYFEPDEQAPTSPAARSTTSNHRAAADANDLNDLSGKREDAGFNAEAQHQASNEQTDDRNSENHLEALSIDQLQSKAGHDQKKKNSMDEFNETYEDFRKIRKIGFDYEYYDD